MSLVTRGLGSSSLVATAGLGWWAPFWSPFVQLVVGFCQYVGLTVKMPDTDGMEVFE